MRACGVGPWVGGGGRLVRASRGSSCSSGSVGAGRAPRRPVRLVRRRISGTARRGVDLRRVTEQDRVHQRRGLVPAVVARHWRLGATGIVAALGHLDVTVGVVLARLDRVVDDDRGFPGVRQQGRTELRHGGGILGPVSLAEPSASRPPSPSPRRWSRSRARTAGRSSDPGRRRCRSGCPDQDSSTAPDSCRPTRRRPTRGSPRPAHGPRPAGPPSGGGSSSPG